MASQPLSAYQGFEYFLVSSPAPLVAHVEINRPKKLNAFSNPVWFEFAKIFRLLSEDPDVNAVILSGAGEKAFTAGLDVQDAAQSGLLTEGSADPARRAKKLRNHIDELQQSLTAMEKCEKPVICVMHGISIGLAIDLSCCADIRICAANTRFAVKEVDIGLAADVGTLARLPKVVGSTSWVKDVCLTARDFTAQEALAVGYVSQVVETKAEAVAVAVEKAKLLAGKSPVAVQGTKELLNHAREHTTADNLRYTGIWNSVALQGADFKAAMTSGLTKTKPRFEKL